MDYKSPLFVVQISDLHLFADKQQDLLGWNTWASFEVIFQQLLTLNPQPDLLLLTGDLSQDETADSYQNLVALLSPLNIPTYWVPGNHDHVPTLSQILNQSPFFPDNVVEAGGWKFLLLNTNVPGQVHGALNRESLQWLAAELDQTPQNQPVLLAMHHPPFLIGSPWLDRSGLQNSEAFFAVVDRSPQVKGVIFGHIHQEQTRSRRGVTYLSAPSTCIQFRPHSANFALDDEQPGFRRFWLYPDGRLISDIQRVCFQQQLDFAAQGY